MCGGWVGGCICIYIYIYIYITRYLFTVTYFSQDGDTFSKARHSEKAH